MSANEHTRGQPAATRAGGDRDAERRDGARRDGGSQVPRAQPRSYYGLPVLNGPVWTWEIPAYFFVGGMAGGSAPLALAASLQGNHRLARAASAVALAGVAASPPLLIADLGRPARFLNMLRMFKLTSPMSVGAWILSAFAPAVVAGAGRELLGVLPRVGRAAQVSGALLGPALSTYTAALLASTSVPVWHEARHELPFVFAGSSLASAGAAATALAGPADSGPARRMAIYGALLSLGATATMEHRLGKLGAPYHDAGAAPFARAAKTLTAAGALAMLAGSFARPAPRRRPRLRARHGAAPGVRALQGGAAGALLAGAALERWAIFKAGQDSAADPAATIGPQRARADAA
ncbi:MAG: hypothetical protein QOE31_961 [Solirubrobacteraceae bacterium]|nr:hypothetical protein [Solirubrobacteraceae bacterium]